MNNILVPLSLWETADVVVEESAKFAAAFGSTVHLMHVVPTPSIAHTNSWPKELREQRDQEVDKLRTKLQERQTHLSKQGLAARTIVVETDDIAAAILEQADEFEVDMIVMGSHERGVLYKAILGDIATEVLRQASCLVTMVPTKLVEKEHARQGKPTLEDE